MRGSSASHYAVILRLSVAKDKHFCINFILIIRKHYDSKKPFPIMVLDAVKSGWYTPSRSDPLRLLQRGPPRSHEQQGIDRDACRLL